MDNLTTTKISEWLEVFRLKYFAKGFVADLGTMTEAERGVILKYLLKWSETEQAERKSALIASKVKSARFRKLQTIDAYDFRHSATTEKIERPYMSLYSDMSREKLPSAVFTGTAGVGKTHLARALG